MSTQIAIISGGTATNSLVNLFHSISSNITYVLPISDNGGSTSEILRVLGGPAIGDIRSRITRLIPDEGFKQLLSHRLKEDNEEAKKEWTQIVEGTHEIWQGVEIQCKEMIRSFLIHVHMELLKKSRNPASNFRYELASIGNLLLTGVRLFVGSLDSAIELVLRMTRIDPNVKILPCLNTNYTYHISALLRNGEIITGQSQISHPQENSPTNLDGLVSTTSVNLYEKNSIHTDHEDVPYQHPSLMVSQLKFSKQENQPLESPIERIFYINSYGEEIHPKANSRTVLSLQSSKTIIYSIGSLMTSIIPVLILQGVGDAIIRNPGKKILLLNGNHDRETMNMTAVDFLKGIYNSVQYSIGNGLGLRVNQVITHLIYLESEIIVDVEEIENLGVNCIKINSDSILDGDLKLYDLQQLQEALLKLIN